MFVSAGGGGAVRFAVRADVADLRAVVFLAGAFVAGALFAVAFRDAGLVAVALRAVAPRSADFLVAVFAAAVFVVAVLRVAVLRVVPVFAAVFRAGAFADFAVVFRVLDFAGAALRVPEVLAAVLRVPDAAEDFLVADLAAAFRVVPVFAVVLRDAALEGALAVFRLLARTAMACAFGRSPVVSSVLTSEISFVPILIIAARIEGRQPRARGSSCCSQ